VKLAGRAILYESTNHAWTYGWTFYQMLAVALAQEADVVYLDQPTSIARGGLRVLGGRADAPAPGVRRLRTAGLPAQRTDAVRFASARAVAAQTARWARRHGFEPELVWTYIPTALPLLDRFPRAASVYWTGDEVRISREEELLRRVDAVLCVSKPVHERHRERLGGKAHFVPVACDFERYHAATGSGRDELPALPRPLLGYSGFVNERTDTELFAAVARALPAASVVVAGPIAPAAARALAGLPNVHLLGPQPAERVPRLIDAFDVALIPYRDTEFNRNSNPVKFYEYLALGKPVVTTDIPTLQHFGAVASVGPAATFVERVEAELAAPTGTPEERVAVARAHSFGALLERLHTLPL
jgi:glycosyltransferase involved in cell wall biosynthesis